HVLLPGARVGPVNVFDFVQQERRIVAQFGELLQIDRQLGEDRDGMTPGDVRKRHSRRLDGLVRTRLIAVVSVDNPDGLSIHGNWHRHAPSRGFTKGKLTAVSCLFCDGSFDTPGIYRPRENGVEGERDDDFRNVWIELDPPRNTDL